MAEPSMNQFAPPRAQVADTAPDGGVAELKLFSAQGRIGRLRYLAYSTGAGLIYNVVVGAMVAALGANAAGATAALILPFAAVVWFNVITGIKRCHDLDISGWWTLTLIVPVITLAWIFMPGTQGSNRYGPKPPPNTLGVRLLGLILPVVFVVGILAAIALPAYHAYTIKARAAQTAAPR